MSAVAATAPSPAPTRDEIEDFLFLEAQLLDGWKLHEWEALFTDDGRYLVPPIGMESPETLDPRSILFLVADDRERMRQRVIRLLKTSAHAEYPRSRTRRMIGNIRSRPEGGDVRVRSNFIVHRMRRGEVMTYMGEAFHWLNVTPDGLRIREKRACLDLETLKPQGALTVIL
jgi:p-cumate 2,3-dioxygenase beta subunit